MDLDDPLGQGEGEDEEEGSLFPAAGASAAGPNLEAKGVSDRYRTSGSVARPSSDRRGEKIRRILFYEQNRPYYNFTNFSADEVEYENKIYPTSEHLFQARKVCHHRSE